MERTTVFFACATPTIMRNGPRKNKGICKTSQHATHFFKMRKVAPRRATVTGERGAVGQVALPTIQKLIEANGIGGATTSRKYSNGVIGLLGLRPEKRNDPYFRLLIDGIYESAEKHGQRITLLTQDSSVDWSEVNGVLLSSNPQANAPMPIPSHLPCVSMLYRMEGVPNVLIDDYHAGVTATQHLLDLGHHTIAFLANPNHPQVVQRISGYWSALREGGITPQNSWLLPLVQTESPYDYFREWGYASMTIFLKNIWKQNGFTALIAQNDWIAVGAMKALQEQGLRIPQDVAVVGFDNLEVCRQVTPSLTSIEAPLHETGLHSLELLLNLIGGEEVDNNTVILPPLLRMRQSTS